MKSVFVAITALLLAAGLAPAEPPKVPQPESAKVARAKADLATLTTACAAYKLKFREYPEKLDQLLSPPRGPAFIDPRSSDLKDPWGKKFEYDRAGKHHQGNLKPDIWTTTPAGEKLGNWPEEKKEK